VVFEPLNVTVAWSSDGDGGRGRLRVEGGGGDMVGRCRLTVSNPVLTAPTVSALETIFR